MAKRELIMADMIDDTTGRAAFARAAGTDVAWHRKGQVFTPQMTRAERRELAGLDWQCVCIPVKYEFNGVLYTAENLFAQVRNDTAKALSVKSERFTPHQPDDVIDVVENLCDADPRFALDTMGALKQGRVIWGLAKFVEQRVIAGDLHDCYVLITTSFDGTLATRMVATPVRVVCNNTITAALYQANREKAYISVRHNVDFSRPDVQRDAVDRFQAVIAEFDAYKALGDALASHRFAKDKVDEFFANLTTAKTMVGKSADERPTGRAKAALDRLQQSYTDTLSEGTEGGTAWAMLNGVTRYVDHNRTVRDTQGDGKEGAQLYSSLIGSGAALKRDAVAMLAEWCGVQLAGSKEELADA
jgi:phage/plasmid-like protein (TIGR03299 family)